jgi:two-component system chemotaxis sensor kinase CheA
VEELGDIVQEFLVESHENLDQLDRDLVELETAPDSRSLISSIFRTIHTIKGTSGFLAFSRLESLTHAGESLLARLRDRVQPVTPATISALLAMVDKVRALLDVVEETGNEGTQDLGIDEVVALVKYEMSEAAQVARATPAATPTPTVEPVAAAEEPAPVVEEPRVSVEVAADVTARVPIGQLLVEGGEVAENDVNSALRMQIEGDDRKLGAILVEEGKAPPAAVGDALQAQGKRSVADSAIRVDVDLLDDLMNLVGELVLVRNQLVRGAADGTDQVLVRTTQRLNLITSELQEGIMKTRMQPIEHLWAKLPRVIRDLSQACGKRIRLVQLGKETELDRSLLEAVKDPLMHLVRNAVDHGVEAAEVREANGKDPEGTLTLRAYHEGGHVTVEVSDDGGGIDVDRVAKIGVERGLIRADQVSTMDSREIMMLVFQPGFSTAKQVTNVSGRGVGMDVVKTNIERIGGAVDVDSTLGQGTTWRLTIPLTLAIIQALTVECAGERYVIPQVAVHELVYIDGQATKIEYVSGSPVYRLRGRLLPLVRLDQTLGLTPGQSDEGMYVAVLQADSRRFGVVVDKVLNTEEVVVKALTARFKDIGLYAGATILGDGKVALILDVASLARRSHLQGGTERERADYGDQTVGAGTLSRLLITGVGQRRVAIPLDTVTRLEEFPREKVERVGRREVVQYRQQILPLVRLSDLLGAMPSEEEGDSVSVVVYTENNRSVALAVDRIVDIVEDTITARRDVDDEGLSGSAVIQQRMTELLDVRRAILAADPNFYAELPGDLLVEA